MRIPTSKLRLTFVCYLRICSTIQVVKETPYRVMEMPRMKEKRFPVHWGCEEGSVRIKDEYEFVVTNYSFSSQMRSLSLTAPTTSPVNSSLSSPSRSNSMFAHTHPTTRPKLYRSHLILVEVQHPASTATIFAI